MADVPLISVLMPAYNARRYVREAVDSILTQTLGDFECIVIDDGSSDDTLAIVNALAARDPRIRVLNGPNAGVSASLNKGLALARGQFIARMDADDISLPTRFEKQARFLQERPNYVLVGSRCMLIDPDGFPICEKTDIVDDHEEIDSLLLRMSWPLVHPAVMMRTDALRKVGGYDTRYRTNQDHDLFLRLAEVGRLANLPEVLLNYRQHFQSIGATKLASQAMTVVDIAKAAHARRSIPFKDPATSGAPVLLRPIDYRRNWWWWALQAGNIATARRQAWAMVRDAPWSSEAWRAMYCALRGH
jgi:glycosyltransferase involved in cell wall biosynthesis